MNKTNEITSIVKYATLLGIFKSFCDRNFEQEKISRIRNIFSRSTDKLFTIKSLIKNETNESISDDEVEEMYKLIGAFLNKSQYRKPISNQTKRELLIKQDDRCAICGRTTDKSAHADHIIPFKYVGDELDNNLQMLCSDCNKHKSASFDYQIRFLLKLL